jgi:hypothetical protein
MMLMQGTHELATPMQNFLIKIEVGLLNIRMKFKYKIC